MDLQEWKATEHGLELGDYSLDSDKIAEKYNGIYGTVNHITSKKWEHYDVRQFIQTWREAMVKHGHEIDEALFERTIRRVLLGNMRRQARKIMQDVLDPIEDGGVFRVSRFGNPTPQETAVDEAVNRIMADD